MTGDLEVVGTLTLPGLERSVAYARRFCRDMLPDHPALDDLNTCVTEAVTNGVVHTRSGKGGKVTITLLASADRSVAEVTDEGADGRLPVIWAELEALNGRGMRIIEALTLRWGVRRDGECTTVWMEFSGGRAYQLDPGAC